MTSATTPDQARPVLVKQIDVEVRDSLLESETKSPPCIRLMALTLRAEEAKLRRILLDLGPDGLEAANLAADFMVCRDKLQGIADLMKTASGRVFLTLEQMEADREITTTEAIEKPLTSVLDAMGNHAA